MDGQSNSPIVQSRTTSPMRRSTWPSLWRPPWAGPRPAVTSLCGSWASRQVGRWGAGGPGGSPAAFPPLRASKATLALASCHLAVDPCCWQRPFVWPCCRCRRAAEQMRATLADLHLREGDVAAALGPLARDGAAGLDWNALMASNPGSLQVRAVGARVEACIGRACCRGRAACCRGRAALF